VLFGNQGLRAFGHDEQRAAQENAPYWASSWLETLFSSCTFFSFCSIRHMYMYIKRVVGDYMKPTFHKRLEEPSKKRHRERPEAQLFSFGFFRISLRGARQ
jgi:hypothetical protein